MTPAASTDKHGAAFEADFFDIGAIGGAKCHGAMVGSHDNVFDVVGTTVAAQRKG
jgi:hypothetical protein